MSEYIKKEVTIEALELLLELVSNDSIKVKTLYSNLMDHPVDKNIRKGLPEFKMQYEIIDIKILEKLKP